MQPFFFRFHIALVALLIAATIFFVFFHEKHLSGFDPSNFALAIKYGYSVTQARPHPPGYPGFYLLWKGIEFVTSFPPHDVLLVTNFIFLLITVLLAYWATVRLFDERVALLVTSLVLTNPVLLYFSCTTELYVYDAAFSAFLVVLLLAPPRKYEAPLYFLYGLLGAFRLSSVILTFPVVLTALYLRYRKTKNIQRVTLDFFAVIMGTAAWLIPFINNVGGWQSFVGIMHETAYLRVTLIQNIFTFLPYHLWMLNILLIIMALHIKDLWRHIRSFDERYIVLILLIVVPGLFFALKYYAKGYALLYLVPVSIAAAHLMYQSRMKMAWIISATAINLLIFFAVPFKEPSIRSVLSHANRNMSERWTSALLRSTSAFAPTNAHLRINDHMFNSSETVFGLIPKGSAIIVDGSASSWVYPRVFQVEHPDLTLLIPGWDDSMLFRRLFKDSILESYDLSRISPEMKLYYITTSNLVHETGAPPGKSLVEYSPFKLYSEPKESRDSLRRYLVTLFSQGQSS